MKQWAVKLTLDYGLADHAHKENQTLVNGKEVPLHPRIPHPHDLFPSPRAGENLWRKSCRWHWGSWGRLPLSLFPQVWSWPIWRAEMEQATERQNFPWQMMRNGSHKCSPFPAGTGCAAALSSCPLVRHVPIPSHLPPPSRFDISVWKPHLFVMISCELIRCDSPQSEGLGFERPGFPASATPVLWCSKCWDSVGDWGDDNWEGAVFCFIPRCTEEALQPSVCFSSAFPKALYQELLLIITAATEENKWKIQCYSLVSSLSFLPSCSTNGVISLYV